MDSADSAATDDDSSIDRSINRSDTGENSREVVTAAGERQRSCEVRLSGSKSDGRESSDDSDSDGDRDGDAIGVGLGDVKSRASVFVDGDSGSDTNDQVTTTLTTTARRRKQHGAGLNSSVADSRVQHKVDDDEENSSAERLAEANELRKVFNISTTDSFSKDRMVEPAASSNSALLTPSSNETKSATFVSGKRSGSWLRRRAEAMCESENAEFGFTAVQDRVARRRAEDAVFRIAELLSTSLARTEQRTRRLAEVEGAFARDVATALFDVEDREEVLQNFASQESARLRKSRTRVGATDFQVIRNLGQGGFGDVYLVQHRRSHDLFAMKEISKHERQRDRDRLMVERSILAAAAATRTRWMVHLAYSFQDFHAAYLVMTYESGGSLGSLLEACTSMSEEHARFYFSEMILAVDTLHRLGFVHRDLKPENFLICRDGHIRVVDFGLAAPLGASRSPVGDLLAAVDGVSDAVVSGGSDFDAEKAGSKTVGGRSGRLHGLPLLRILTRKRRTDKHILHPAERRQVFSCVGSPEYMAPEVLQRVGYGMEADWWSLGVNLFELMTGTTPFLANTADEVFANIHQSDYVLSCLESEAKSVGMTDNAWDLGRLLMTADGNKRAGTRRGICDLLHHDFFAPYWHPSAPTSVSRSDVAVFERHVIGITPPHIPDTKGAEPVSTTNEPFAENRRQKLNKMQRILTLEGFAFTAPAEMAKQSLVRKGSSAVGSPSSERLSKAQFVDDDYVLNSCATSSCSSASSQSETAIRVGFDPLLDGRRRSASLPTPVDFDRARNVDQEGFSAASNLLRDVSVPSAEQFDQDELLTKAREAVRPGARTADEVLCRKVFKLMVDTEDKNSLLCIKRSSKSWSRFFRNKPSKVHPASRVFERKHITNWLSRKLDLSQMDAFLILDRLLQHGYFVEANDTRGNPDAKRMSFRLFCGLDVFCLNSLRHLDRAVSADRLPLIFDELGNFFRSCLDIVCSSLQERHGVWMPSLASAALFIMASGDGMQWDVVQERALVQLVKAGRRAFDRFVFLSSDLSSIAGLSKLEPDDLLCFLLNCHNALAVSGVIQNLRGGEIPVATLWKWVFRCRRVYRTMEEETDVGRAAATALVGPAFEKTDLPVPPFTFMIAGCKTTISDLAILTLAGSSQKKRAAYDRMMADVSRAPMLSALPVSMRHDPRLAVAIYSLNVNDGYWLPQVFQARRLDEQLNAAVNHAVAGRVRVHSTKRTIYLPENVLRLLGCFSGLAQFLRWILSFDVDADTAQLIRELAQDGGKVKLGRWKPEARDTRRMKFSLGPEQSIGRRFSAFDSEMPAGRPRSASDPLWLLESLSNKSISRRDSFMDASLSSALDEAQIDHDHASNADRHPSHVVSFHIQKAEETLRRFPHRTVLLLSGFTLSAAEWHALGAVAKRYFSLVEVSVDGTVHTSTQCSGKPCDRIHTTLNRVLEQNARLARCATGAVSFLDLRDRGLPFLLESSADQASGDAGDASLGILSAHSFVYLPLPGVHLPQSMTWVELGQNVRELDMSSNLLPSFADLVISISSAMPKLAILLVDDCNLADLDLPASKASLSGFCPGIFRLSAKRNQIEHEPAWLVASLGIEVLLDGNPIDRLCSA